MTNWQEAVEVALWDAICSALGLDAGSDAAAALIRYADRDDGTDVRPPRTTDVIYISVSPEQDTGATAWVASAFDNGEIRTVRTIPLTCLLVCYGPQSSLYADALWAGIWADLGPGSPRDVLRRANLTPVPPLNRPTLAPEPEDGNWRKRADLRVRMNLHLESAAAFVPVASPPDVSIET